MTIKRKTLVIVALCVAVVIIAGVTVAGFALSGAIQAASAPVTDTSVDEPDASQEVAPAEDNTTSVQVSGPLSGKKIYMLDSNCGIALSESSAASLASQAAERGCSSYTIAVLINTGVEVADTQTGATFVARQGNVNLGNKTKVYDLEGISFEELQNLNFNNQNFGSGRSFVSDYGTFTFYS